MGQKRMLSALDFSPKFPELLCTAYTKSQASPHVPPGLLNVWNQHLKSRPEYSPPRHLGPPKLYLPPLQPLPHPRRNVLRPTLSLGYPCSKPTNRRARPKNTTNRRTKRPRTSPYTPLAVVGTQNARQRHLCVNGWRRLRLVSRYANPTTRIPRTQSSQPQRLQN